jgi:lipoate-protein ligase A
LIVRVLPALDARENLCAEERAFLRGEPCALLWRNTPCVILGRSQDAQREVSAWGRENLPVLRRSTGGGAVYQDTDNVNVSFVCPEPLPRELRAYVQPVLDFLHLLGLPAVFSGRNDILLDGRKISGCAMRHDGGCTLAHATLLFRRDADAMERALTPDPDKLARHGVASVRSRTGELAPYLPQFADAGAFADALAHFLERQKTQRDSRPARRRP